MILKFSDYINSILEMNQHTKIKWEVLDEIINTDEFKMFFKGSKMTFKGKPVVFFHGTKKQFDGFDKKQISSSTDVGWLGKGFYFYSDISESRQYGNVTAYFLNIQKPYKAKQKDMERLANLDSHEASQKFTDNLIKKGYDGVFYDADLRGEAVVYEPSQIFKIELDVNSII